MFRAALWGAPRMIGSLLRTNAKFQLVFLCMDVRLAEVRFLDRCGLLNLLLYIAATLLARPGKWILSDYNLGVVPREPICSHLPRHTRTSAPSPVLNDNYRGDPEDDVQIRAPLGWPRPL